MYKYKSITFNSIIIFIRPSERRQDAKSELYPYCTMVLAYFYPLGLIAALHDPHWQLAPLPATAQHCTPHHLHSTSTSPTVLHTALLLGFLVPLSLTWLHSVLTSSSILTSCMVWLHTYPLPSSAHQYGCLHTPMPSSTP